MGGIRHVLGRAVAVAAAVTLIGSGVALADNLVADGDGATPIANNALAFGPVCANTVVTKPVLTGIQGTGHPGAGTNVFASSAVVTVTVGPVAGSGLSATVPASPNNRITLPANWPSTPNNTIAAGTVTSTVTFTAGTAPAPIAGAVNYVATGTGSTGGTLTRTTSVPVTGSVVLCDTTPPTLNLPPNQTVEATGPGGATVTYTATATDTSPANPTVTCTPASGSTFPIATTTVNCSAKDAAGNTATGSFTVTVRDTTAPSIANTPTDVTAEATSGSGAVVNFTPPTATDIVDGVRPVTCDHASGETFALGRTTVTCTASDTRGNTATSSFQILVQDTTAPVIVVPGPITSEATGPTGAAVSYTASATDIVDGAITPDCRPPSGSAFPLGETTVTCSASDTAGNSASEQFTVSVVDTTPPELTLTGATEEATGPGGANVTYTATATDLVDGSITPVCDKASGSLFPLGSTTVTCTATDAHGNTSTGQLTAVVVDTTPPALTLPASAVVVATSPAGATFSYTATASDIVDGVVPVTCTPASGSTFPLAQTTTVACSATDAHSNTGTGSFTVSVQYGRDGGILQPINPDNSSLFSRGRAIPVKFQLKNDQPSGFVTTSWTVQRVQINCISGEGTVGEDVPSVTPSSALRYDATADQYIYNADFRDKPAGSCWKVVVDLKDGSLPLNSAVFKLQK